MPIFEGEDILRMKELMDDKAREDYLDKKERIEKEIDDMLEEEEWNTQ